MRNAIFGKSLQIIKTNHMLNICDAELLGKKIIEGDLNDAH